MAKIRTGRRGAVSRPQSDVASTSTAEALGSSAVDELAVPVRLSSGSDLEMHAGAHARAPAARNFLREAILVLGMHRSGTSALTGALIRLGATAPATPMAADQGNERGYFESVPFMVLHDQLLASAGSRWDDWRRFDLAWLTSFEAEKFRAEARKLLLDEFGDTKLLVLKDPRACRFIPFWKSVLAEAGTALRVVIPLRSPIEVARSLRNRDGMPLTKGLLIWLRHAVEAERETRDVPRAIVVMEEFLSDWRSDLQRIADEIGLAWPRSIEEAAPEIDAFLSADLVHQHAAEDEHSTLHGWALRAYKALHTLAHDPSAHHARATLDEIASAFEASCDLFGTLLSESTADIEALRGAQTSARHEADTARHQLEMALAATEAERSRVAEHNGALETTLSETRAAAEHQGARLSEAAAAAETERDAALGQVASLSMALEAANSASAHRETVVVRLKQDAAEAEGRFDALRQTIHGHEAEIGRLQAELDSERRRSAGDEARLALLDRLRAEQVEGLIELRRQLVQEQERADAAARDLAGRSATIEVLNAALRDERGLRSNLEARNSTLAESTAWLEARISSVSRRLDQRNEELVEAREEVTRIGQRLAQESSRADEAEVASAALAEAMERAEAERAMLSLQLTTMEQALNQASSERADLSRNLESSAATIRLADERAAQSRRDLERAESERATLATRLDGATRDMIKVQADAQLGAEAAERSIQALQAEVQRRECGEILRENELAALLKSSSWQLTRPFRTAVRALSRLKRSLRHGRKDPLFDTNWYLEQYRDVRLSGWDPYAHYLRHGAAEGRDPSPLFDTDWYLQQNPDVRESGMNPLVHYSRYGEKEGRHPTNVQNPVSVEQVATRSASLTVDVDAFPVLDAREGKLSERQTVANAVFDADWYLQNNPDVQAAGVDAYWHYVNSGEREGRKPTADFDPRFYLALYGDVRGAGLGAFAHYVSDGLREGRIGKLPIQMERAGAPTILFVGHDSYAAGAQRVLLEIIRWFRSHTFYKIKIILLGSGHLTTEYGKLAECFTVSNDINYDISDIINFIGGVPHVVYCNTIVSGKIFLTELSDYLADCTVVTHCHELDRVLEIFSSEAEALYRRSDYWICASPATARLLQRNPMLKDKSVATVPAFIEPSKLTEGDRLLFRSEQRRLLNLNDDTFVVVGCGTLHWRKDPDIFVQTAISAIERSKSFDIAFLWVGDGEEFDELTQKINASGFSDRILLVGRRSDAANFMCVGDVFFLSSQEDPFPLVVLEAAQFGLPSVCFAGATGMEDFIGSRGRVVSSRAPAAAAAAILELAENQEVRSRLGRAAHDEVFRSYISAAQIPHILANLHCAGVRPAVSVVVPNYNHENFISDRLDSILRQTFQDFEVIVLDDCSSDNSVDKITPFLRDPRVRFISNDVNSGSVFKQWERGVRQAKAELIWIAESDDLCDANFLKTLSAYMLDPDVNIAFGRTEIIDEVGVLVPGALKPYLDRFSPGFGEQAFLQTGPEFVNAGFGALCSIVNASGALLRKAALVKALPDAMKFRVCGDWRIYLEACIGGAVAYDPRAVNYFRRHSQSTVHKLEGTDTYFSERVNIADFVVSTFRTSPCLRQRMQAEINHEVTRFRGRYDEGFSGDLSALFRGNLSPDFLDQKHHVCFYVHGLLFSKGGIERLFAMISSALVERGFKVSVFCNPSEGGAPVFALRSGVKVVQADIQTTVGKAALRAFLVDEQVNLFVPMLSEWLFEHAIDAVDGLEIPIVASEHNNPRMIEDLWWSRERRIAYFSRVQAIHLVTHIFKRSLPLSLWPKVKIIEHPVAPEFSNAIRRPNSTPTILGVGRLVRQKRFDLLIDAFALLAEEFPEWRVCIFGDGEERKELEALVASRNLSGRVALPGTTDNIVCELEKAEMFVLSSEFEATGLAFIEALATGTPVVAFEHCEGTNEFISSGHNGLLAPEFNAASLAAAMRCMMADAALRLACGQRGRQIAQVHDISKIADEWETLILSHV
uniref:Glycosyltransferase n=1 Tax=Bosea sp. NBC_00436 TaxID=2969620 RepID=A0A9E8CKV0_9HYPH